MNLSKDVEKRDIKIYELDTWILNICRRLFPQAGKNTYDFDEVKLLIKEIGEEHNKLIANAKKEVASRFLKLTKFYVNDQLVTEEVVVYEDIESLANDIINQSEGTNE